jgi:hypothetical protein
MNEHKIPKGFTRCSACGEYNGVANMKDLNWEGSAFEEAEESEECFSVTCLCHGIPCPKCKKNKIHRPISNSYDEKSNSGWHYPLVFGHETLRRMSE